MFTYILIKPRGITPSNLMKPRGMSVTIYNTDRRKYRKMGTLTCSRLCL